MSRKTLMSVIAVIGAVLVFLKSQFGLALNTTAILGGVTAILLYVLWEAKADLQKIGKQMAKWKDPKFWITFVSAILAAVNTEFGLGIPVEAVIAVLTLIVGILFKVEKRELSPN